MINMQLTVYSPAGGWRTSFNSGALDDPLMTAVLNNKLLVEPDKK